MQVFSAGSLRIVLLAASALVFRVVARLWLVKWLAWVSVAAEERPNDRRSACTGLCDVPLLDIEAHMKEFSHMRNQVIIC